MKKFYLLTIFVIGVSGGINGQGLCLDCDASKAYNNGLEACFPFNGNALDQSGNSNNGTIKGPDAFFDRKGRKDSAFLFNGSHDHITVNNLFDYSSRTYSVWFRVLNATTVQNVIVSDDPSLTNGLTAISVQNTGTLQVAYSVGSTATFKADIAYNVWCHASIVVNGSNVTYYLNGKSVYTGSNNNFKSIHGSGKTVIGGSRDTSTYWFNGSIDDIRIYSRALTSVQIDSLFRDNCYDCDSVYVSNDSLKACFPFNADAMDESGNTNHGGIRNAVLSSDRYSVVQNAYQFDGNGDFIAVGNLFDYEDRTYSIWFKADNAGGFQNIIVSDDPALDQGLTGIGVNTTSGQKVVVYSLGNAANRSYPVTNGVWYHAAIVVDDDQAWYYLNGTDMSGALTNDYFSSIGGSGSTIIGGSRDTTTYWFKGLVDDVKIYSRALTPAEIMNLSRDTTCWNKFDCTQDTGTGPSSLRNIDDQDLTVYPNPGNGLVSVVLPTSGKISQVRVYSVDGKEQHISALSGTTETTLDLTALAQGLYIIHITDQNGQLFRAKYSKE